MSLSGIYFLSYVFNALNWIFAVVFSFGLIALIVYVVYNFSEYSGFEEEEAHKIKKRTIKFIAVLFVILVIGCFIPTKEVFLSWAILRYVDQYNVSNELSIYQPENALIYLENLFHSIENILSK